MFKHVVLYKLKDNSEESKRALTETFLSMKGKIDVLLDITAGGDELKTARSFDVCLICTFKNAADLPVYSEHPVHQRVRQYVLSVIEKAHSVDFEEKCEERA